MPCNYKYFVTGHKMSMTDQDDVCKLGSVCCALPPFHWSQLRSEMEEHVNGWCCQPSKCSTFRFSFFSEFPVEIKHIFSLIITGVNIYHQLLIKLQKRCYAAALVENFVATFPQAIFLHAVIFSSCIATFQFLNHWAFSRIFILTKFSFVFCIFFNSCNDGWAGSER